MARELLAVSEGSEVTLAVSRRGLESAALTGSGLEYVELPAGGIVGRSLVGKVRGLAALARGLRAASRLVRAVRPDAALGMGGYPSVAPVIACRNARVPTAVYEPNAVPGLATRTLAPGADVVLLGCEEAASRLRARRLEVVGVPVRREVLEADPEEGRKLLGVPEGHRLLLVVGGSQGARSLNALVAAALSALSRELSGWYVLHLCGPGRQEDVAGLYGPAGVAGRAVDFLREIWHALAAADLAVARCGASTLAELACRGVPSVLVPLPGSAGGHQEANGRLYERGGGALVVLEEEGVEALVDALRRLLVDTERREAMREAMKRIARPEAAGLVARTVLGIARGGGSYVAG